MVYIFMKRKSIIIAISFFLAILFLSTIGSIYTGYATLDQSRLTLKYYPYPFVKNNVSLMIIDTMSLK